MEKVREMLRKSNPFSELALITEARCEEDKCYVKVRVPEFSNKGTFKISEKRFIVDKKTKEILGFEEIE